MEKQFRLHKETGLLVAEDGEVMWTTTYKTGHQHTWRTYGCKKKNGYMAVKFKGKWYSVHRLVAETYIPNPANKPCIDHIIPVSMGGTNDVSNLRWCTYPENSNNPLTRKNLSDASGENKKPVIGVNKTTGYTVEFESAKDAWLTLNIARQSITACCRGRIKSAGGYYWHYA